MAAGGGTAGRTDGDPPVAPSRLFRGQLRRRLTIRVLRAAPFTNFGIDQQVCLDGQITLALEKAKRCLRGEFYWWEFMYATTIDCYVIIELDGFVYGQCRDKQFHLTLRII